MMPLDNASLKLAKALWTAAALKLSADEFQSRFDAIYATAKDPSTLWQLGGAANDYWRLHPNSISVPLELPVNLLNAQSTDSRIIGLKLLVRCSQDIPLLGHFLCIALASPQEEEISGGLYELGRLLEQHSPSQAVIDKLLFKLRNLSTSHEAYIRESATQFIDRLSDDNGD